MTWYLPPSDAPIPSYPPVNYAERDVDVTLTVKEGAKYLIPATVFGVVFKELSDRFANFPVDAIVGNAKIAVNCGYISCVALMVLGIYKMARNMEDQRNPPPEMVKVPKLEYDTIIAKNEDLDKDNTRLLAELERFKQENAQLRTLLNQFIPDR